MPTAPQILDVATTIANELRALAVAWHVALGALLIALLLRWRPSARMLVYMFAAPVASVALASAAYGNPFNAIMFTALAAVFVIFARREAVTAARVARTWPIGVAMVAFAWLYPHFLAGPSIAYLVAAPVGLIPCPTIALLLGLALLFADDLTRATRWTIVGVAAFYAVVGVLHLGVVLDIGLVLGAAALAARRLRPAYAPLTGTTIESNSRPVASMECITSSSSNASM